jgi:regulatory protein
MIRTKQLSKEQALQKLRHYCAYQERCHAEVKEKLYSFGLHKQEVEESITQLIEENYLNEERFARQFAGGKFRMKQWGRNKIKEALKQKRVSDYCIRKALQEIDEQQYQETLEKLAIKKWRSIRGQSVNRYVRSAKTTAWLMQKGYETDAIRRVVRGLAARESSLSE